MRRPFVGSIFVAGLANGVLHGQASAGNNDVFVARYEANGTKVWTKQFGSSNHDQANAVFAGSSDAIYVAGSAGGNLNGAIGFGSWSSSDAFITKLSAKVETAFPRSSYVHSVININAKVAGPVGAVPSAIVSLPAGKYKLDYLGAAELPGAAYSGWLRGIGSNVWSADYVAEVYANQKYSASAVLTSTAHLWPSGADVHFNGLDAALAAGKAVSHTFYLDQPSDIVLFLPDSPASLSDNNGGVSIAIRRDLPIWLNRSMTGSTMYVDVMVGQGANAYGVDFDLSLGAGLTYSGLQSISPALPIGW
ncbi:MAG: hypothetical protein EBX92_09620, partial [Actinobacteria bacterium]|nr:hypothetical protein [Actinomycetota bacterium]